MTLCILVRTGEGIAIATDTTTTTQRTFDVEGKSIVKHYHTYFRRKLVQIDRWAVVHTGIAFIGNRTVSQLLEESNLQAESFDELHQIVTETVLREFEEDVQTVSKLPVGQLLLTLGLAGYEGNTIRVQSISFRKGESSLIDVKTQSDTTKSPYGISYWGDYAFIELVVATAIKRGLLKATRILTLQEGLDFARVLLKFLIDFQKFMVQSSVDYPIESAVITRKDGFKWVDKMKIKPHKK